MAEEQTNNAGKAGENLKNTFSDVNDLIKELNGRLKETLKLVGQITEEEEEADKAKEAATAKAAEAKARAEQRNLQIQKAANAVIDILYTQMLAVDKETTAMARNLNMSKNEALGVKKQFGIIALNSGDIAINSERLAKANASLNAQLGTGVVFSGEMLKTFSKLTEVVGISAEAAGSLAFQGQLAGQSFREVEENVLGASYSMQRGAGIQLSMKDVLEATGKVTGTLRANLGANPEAIAKAVTQAKLLGTELETLSAAGKTLLDFESSIEKELEAELITGKELNLEKARAAALAGDELTLQEELSKNFGTHKEFLDMNVIQREKLAAAVGMEAGAMADMLLKQETMNMNAEQLRAIGKSELADRVEQLDVQQKIALAQEKFQAMMGEVMIAVMPLVEAFSWLVSALSESKKLTAGLIGLIVGLAAAAKVMAFMNLVGATAKLFGENAKFGPVGIGIALAGVAGMVAAVASVGSMVEMAEGGIVKPRPGGTPAIIGEAGESEMVVPLSKAKQMGFGGDGSNQVVTQPVVIQNNWDAFAASNGNGRRGLGGTQALQASPTFA